MADIPEGYTYTRCDRYSKEEFIGMFQSRSMRQIVLEYVETNQKALYDTDDEIAVHQIHNEQTVNSMYNIEHTRTTKRYHYNYGSH